MPKHNKSGLWFMICDLLLNDIYTE